MKGKVILNDTYKIYFSYGVYSLNDLKFIKSVIHLFVYSYTFIFLHKIFPKLSDLNKFRKINENIKFRTCCINSVHRE